MWNGLRQALDVGKPLDKLIGPLRAAAMVFWVSEKCERDHDLLTRTV